MQAPTEDELASGRSATVGASSPPSTAAGCPVSHQSVATEAPALDVSAPDVPAGPGCPVRSPAPAPGGCPVAHGPDGLRRSPADLVVRRLLRIRERPAGVTSASAYGSFQRSMLISAVRCTLTYVVFPFVAPAVGVATGVGPLLGLLIGSFAIVCDVFTIRRFFAVDHGWRWPVSAVAFSVICLLAVLAVQDVSHLLR